MFEKQKERFDANEKVQRARDLVSRFRKQYFPPAGLNFMESIYGNVLEIDGQDFLDGIRRISFSVPIESGLLTPEQRDRFEASGLVTSLVARVESLVPEPEKAGMAHAKFLDKKSNPLFSIYKFPRPDDPHILRIDHEQLWASHPERYILIKGQLYKDPNPEEQVRYFRDPLSIFGHVAVKEFTADLNERIETVDKVYIGYDQI